MDFGDGSLFPEMSVVSLDDQTINSPPEPVAASTVHRPGSARRQMDERQVLAPININQRNHMQMIGQSRLNQNNLPDPRGSFLDNHQWSLPSSPRDPGTVKKAPITYMSFSDHVPTAEVDWSNLQNNSPGLQSDRETIPADDRSSLGILPSHLIKDTSFGIGEAPSADLLRFGEESGRVSSQQTGRSNTRTLERQSSASSTDHSKNLWMGETSNGRQMMATVKRPAALGACDLMPSENEEDPEPSICEVQFEAAELQDLDDEFSDLSVEDQREDYSPVSLDLEGEGGIEDEVCPSDGPLQHDSDLESEDELQAVRDAMRQSLGGMRQHGVGSSQDTDSDAGSDYFPDFQTRHSAEGEVVSPFPDGFSGSSDDVQSSDGIRFERPDHEPYKTGHPPQEDERCVEAVDEDSPAACTVDASRIDSMYFKPAACNPGRESELPLDGYGLADESSCHFFGDMVESPDTEQKLEAAGFSPQQFEGQNPFTDAASFCPQFDISLGLFGASPDRELPELDAHGPGRFDAEMSVLGGNSPDFQAVFSQEADPNDPKDSSTSKKYISDNSPVYLDENGVGVTDLAYHKLFVNEALYQQEALKTLQDNPNGEKVWTENFTEDEFIPMENALNMLNEDEKKFQADNIFIKDDKMVGDPFYSPNDESWMMKNSICMTQSMMHTDLMRHGNACFRISIGEFMRSRSGALGSLGGDASAERPCFGSKIITPPSNRPPVKLLNDQEAKDDQLSLRLDGVGLDSKDAESTRDEGPMTMEDISKSNSHHSSPGPRETVPQDDQHARQLEDGEDFEEVDISTVVRPSDMYEVSLSDKTGALSLSAITEIMSSAPANSKPQDLAKRLMAVAKAKALEKKSGKNERNGSQGSDVESNNSVFTKAKSHMSKLPVRRSSNNSPKSDTSGTSSTQENQPSKLRDQRQRKGSAAARTPPVGSTESKFTPGQTITVTKPLVTETMKPQLDFQDDETVGGSPTVFTSGTGAGDGMSPQTQECTSHQRSGEIYGADHNQQQVKEAFDSPKDLLAYSPKSTNQKSDSPRLSEIANNMGIDLSKIEVNPDFTLSDSLAASTAAEKNVLAAEINREDPKGSKKAAKTGLPDSQVFKKPQTLPARKAQGPKTNPGLSGTSAFRRMDKPSLDTISKQTAHSRTKTVVNKGPNKENHFNCSKPSIPDKVLETSKIGENILGRGVNGNKQSSKTVNTTVNTRRSVNSAAKQIKPTDTLSARGNIPKQITGGGNRPQGNDEANAVPNVQVTRSSSSPVNNYNPPPVNHLPDLETPYPESKYKIPKDIEEYSEIKTPNLPSDSDGFYPVSQRFPFTHEQFITKSNPDNVEHHEDVSMLPVNDYSSYMPGNGMNLLTPHNASTRPRVMDNLVTPARQPGLDGQSMLSFDNGPPAYHSTPFYHALTPCDNSVFNAVSPEKCNVALETPPPQQTEGVGKVKLLDLPSHLKFEETCCVGVSTKTTLIVRNLSQHWVRCTLNVQQLNMNGQACVLNVPFMFDQSTILEPLSTGSINVIFVPSHRGLYTGQLAVSGCPVSQDPRLQSAYSMPDYVPIEAVADTPNIQIRCDNYLSLMFGEVYRGSSKSLPLTLINNGRCTVPLRLTITATNSSWHCFTFERTSLGDPSTVWGSTHNRTILNLTLPGNTAERGDTANTTVNVYCKPPPPKFSKVSLPVDLIHAKIDIEVDTPSIKILVKTVSLQAVVGEVYLLVPSGLECLELISGGERAVTTFCVKNGGNLKMKLKLMPREFESDFMVSPTNTIVDPGKGQDIQVTFYPQSRKPVLQTELLMTIDPSGPRYETKLIGKYLPEPAEKPLVEILCSKNYVAFGGVEMGKVSCQRLGLLHHSPNRLKLKLEIRCPQPLVFQIKTVVNQTESLTSAKEVYVSPHEEYPVYLVFNPNSLAQCKGKLLIKQEGCAKKFSLCLSGYGGSKQIVLDDTYDDSRGRGYSRNITIVPAGFSSCDQQYITVWNVGSRAAFVKVFCFSDANCKVVDNNIADFFPDLFVVKAGASQVLNVRLNPKSRQFINCQFKRSLMGVLKFYYGDEVSRRLYKRSGSSARNLPQSHPLSGVDLKVQVMGEDNIEQGADLFESSPTDSEQFYKGICRLSLSLFGCPVSNNAPDNSSGNPTTLPSSQDTNQANRNRLIGLSPVPSTDPGPSLNQDILTRQLAARRLAGVTSPVLGLDLNPGPGAQLTAQPTSNTAVSALRAGPSLTPHLQEKLEVYPRHLILDVHSNGGSEGHVLMRNLTDEPICFQFCWSCRKLKIDKDSGKIAPRETCVSTLSPSNQILSDDIPLPWSGAVIIDALSERKEVAVLIRRGIEAEKVTSISPSKVSAEDKIAVKESPNNSRPANAPAKLKTVIKSSAVRSSSLSNQNQSVTKSVQRRSLQKTASDSRLNQLAYTKSLSKRSSSQTMQSNSQSKVPDASPKSHPQASLNKVPQSPTTADEKIIFTASHVGQASERTLILSNSTDQPVIWTLSPFTPPYLKVLQSGEVHRIGYDVFKCSRMSGDLQPHESIQIFVQFEPQDIGYFSQFLEIRKREDGQGSNQTIEKVQLLAEGLPASSPRVTSLQDQYNLDTTASSISTSKSKQQSRSSGDPSCVICLLSDSLVFSVWNTQQSERKKAQIKNKDSVIHRIEVIGPQPPFYVSHSSLKIRDSHYVKLPIDFRPTEKGTFEGIVVLRPDFGPSLSLKLRGTCGK